MQYFTALAVHTHTPLHTYRIARHNHTNTIKTARKRWLKYVHPIFITITSECCLVHLITNRFSLPRGKEKKNKITFLCTFWPFYSIKIIIPFQWNSINLLHHLFIPISFSFFFFLVRSSGTTSAPMLHLSDLEEPGRAPSVTQQAFRKPPSSSASGPEALVPTHP